MDMILLFLIAVGLSMDSFAASIANGLCFKKIKIGNVLKTSLFFALFQGLMPIGGWLVGSILEAYIMKIDHWIAFILLSAIGLKMIWSSVKNKKTGCIRLLALSSILFMSLATSIDAFIIGISISFIGYEILFAALIIGLTTFIFSFAGMYIGKVCGRFLENKVEIAGGVILILLGLKILVDHVMLM